MNEARSLGFHSSGTSLIVRSTLFTFLVAFSFSCLFSCRITWLTSPAEEYIVILGLELFSSYLNILGREKERVRTEWFY